MNDNKLTWLENELQSLKDQGLFNTIRTIGSAFGLAVTVCHYPTGASKWNPIEHHLFSYISGNWAGVPLRSLETMLKYIRTTTTQTGLKVRAQLNKKKYLTRLRIDDDQMAKINIRRHRVLPEWNYTIYPTGNVWSSEPI